MTGLRLNLGCGLNKQPGYINVDMYGEPDVQHDLEVFPWPWPDNSVVEIVLNHVLEHLGQSPKVYRDLWKEMYRVCAADARIHITVPHFRHDNFYADPTHVRAVTPLGLALMSQRLNRQWASQGAANSPLGLYWQVNFELIETDYTPSAEWFRLHPEENVDAQLILSESTIHNNLIEEASFVLQVVK